MFDEEGPLLLAAAAAGAPSNVRCKKAIRGFEELPIKWFRLRAFNPKYSVGSGNPNKT